MSEKTTLPNPAGLRAIIDQVDYARSRDCTREALTSIFLEPDLNGEAVVAVTTDGHRLAMARLRDRFPLLPNMGLLLLPEKVAELKKTLHLRGRARNPVELDVVDTETGPALRFRRAGAPSTRVLLRARADDGAELDFPNWRNVVPDPGAPDAGPLYLVDNSEALAQAVEAVARVRGDGNVTLYGGDRVEGKQVLHVRAEETLDLGDVRPGKVSGQVDIAVEGADRGRPPSRAPTWWTPCARCAAAPASASPQATARPASTWRGRTSSRW